ncbi:MAG: hypothetical protein KC517_07345 [Bacteroidetes bacterium]|jgi:hypothetical protein|nr:hypothetical protein [Bacteroidota bacterium]
MANKVSKKRLLVLIILSFGLTMLVYNPIKRALVSPKKSKATEVPAQVFYANHIAGILNDHCITCHRANGSAPFTLDSYNKVFRKKTTMRKVIEKGIMPPWPADPTYSHFIGENILTKVEKKIIYKWIEQGARFGDSTKLPELPKYSKVSNLGEPDVTVPMDSILVPGNNLDKFFVVKSPFEIPHDTFIRAIEFVPGPNQMVHHLNADLILFEEGKKADVFDGIRVVDEEIHPEEYELAYKALKTHHDDGSLPFFYHSAVNYLPGVVGTIYPEGIGGYRVNRKGAFFARDIHYAPIQKDQWDHSHYNIFYSKTPPTRLTKEMMLGTNGLSPIRPQLVIPADSIKTFSTRFRIHADMSVLTINPHMHLLGKSLKAFAVTNVNDTIPLIRINRWDFRWQYFYTFPNILKLPEGAVIVVEATFDNTVNNKNNPNNPPIKVSERYDGDGALMRTTDEMFQFIITYLDYEDGDEQISLDPGL